MKVFNYYFSLVLGTNPTTYPEYKCSMDSFTLFEYFVYNNTVFQGPFDGILGFSQGASFVSLLLALQEQKGEFTISFGSILLFSTKESGVAKVQHHPSLIIYLSIFMLYELNKVGKVSCNIVTFD